MPRAPVAGTSAISSPSNQRGRLAPRLRKDSARLPDVTPWPRRAEDRGEKGREGLAPGAVGKALGGSEAAHPGPVGSRGGLAAVGPAETGGGHVTVAVGRRAAASAGQAQYPLSTRSPAGPFVDLAVSDRARSLRPERPRQHHACTSGAPQAFQRHGPGVAPTHHDGEGAQAAG